MNTTLIRWVNPQECKKDLQAAIDEVISYNESLDAKSWGGEAGILFSANEVKNIIEFLKAEEKEVALQSAEQIAKRIINQNRNGSYEEWVQNIVYGLEEFKNQDAGNLQGEDDKTENKLCCVDCGIKYLTEKQKQEGFVTTFHKGICCLCGHEKSVTSIRHYNNLKINSQ